MKRWSIALAVVGSAWASQAMAITNFAGYVQTDTNLNFSYTESTLSTAATIAISSPVIFSITALGQSVNASLTLTASAPTSDYVSVVGSNGIPAYGVKGFNGTLSFVTTQAYTINGVFYASGSDLLDGSFTNATLTAGDSTGSVSQTATLNAAIGYSSPAGLFSFDPAVARDLSISLSSVLSSSVNGPQNGFQIDTSHANVGSYGYLVSAQAVSSGTFGTTPAPLISGVPEAATWGMMVIGFGAIGASLRRKQTSIAFG